MSKYVRSESSKGIILIDMDNTIVDYSSRIVKELRPIYQDQNITVDNWQLLKLTDLHYNRRLIQSRPGFFRTMRPIKGAFDALKEMEEGGYSVFIVSSPSISGKNCHSEKCEWLKEHFGEFWARRLVLTKDKTVVMGDILIDDKPNITGCISNPMWKHIRYAQPYNVDLDDKDEYVYLYDWSNWKVVVESTLKV